MSDPKELPDNVNVASRPMRCSDSTKKQCVAIVQAILELCEKNEDHEFAIAFTNDWEKYSATVLMPELGHSHIGYPGCKFKEAVDSLHGMLCHQTGLSFVKDS